MQKQLTSSNGLVLFLIVFVIVVGAINRVIYKIQVTDRTMKPYAFSLFSHLPDYFAGTNDIHQHNREEITRPSYAGMRYSSAMCCLLPT